jgi:hypothetical protein
MIYNIINNPNRNEDFTSRSWAMRTIARTWSKNIKNCELSDLRRSVYIPKSDIDIYLNDIGFNVIDSAEEGGINILGGNKKESFFPGKYLGLTAVHEYLCSR